MKNPLEKPEPEKAFEEGMATQFIAEGAARKEGLSKPTRDHYAMISKMIDTIRSTNPELAEGLISMSAEVKELRDAMGQKNYEMFYAVQKEVGDSEIQAMEVRWLKKFFPDNESDFDRESFKKYFSDILDEVMKKSFERIFSDSRVEAAFAGKPDLLAKSKNLFKHQLISQIKIFFEERL